MPFVNDVWTKREGTVLINVLFSSENGKNKVVAKRECKHSRTTKSLHKVPIVAMAFHVMPRQRLYSDDFGQIPIFACPLSGIKWNAYNFQSFAVSGIFLRRFQALPACHGMSRHFMKSQISPNAYDIYIKTQNFRYHIPKAYIPKTRVI